VCWHHALLECRLRSNVVGPPFASEGSSTVWVHPVKEITWWWQSKGEELKEAATRDKDLIREQLAIYEPQIIIACGRGHPSTFRLLRDSVFCAADRARPIQKLPRDAVKCVDAQLAPKPFCLLAAYHPSAFVSKETQRSRLCSDYDTIVREMESEWK
jgi:hypothetical protein